MISGEGERTPTGLLRSGPGPSGTDLPEVRTPSPIPRAHSLDEDMERAATEEMQRIQAEEAEKLAELGALRQRQVALSGIRRPPTMPQRSIEG